MTLTRTGSTIQRELPEGEELAISRASNSHLAIHLGEKSIYCSVYDLDKDEIIWINTFPISESDTDFVQVEKIFATEKIFERPFRKCTLSNIPGEFSIVPEGFFDESKKEQLLGTVNRNTKILHQLVKSAGAAVIFGFPEMAEKKATPFFPTLRIMSFAALMTEFAISQALTGDEIFIYSGNHRIFLVVTRNKQFMLCNQYETRRADDVLYHLANTAIQLGIDLASVKIHLSGESDSLQDLDTMINTYCGSLNRQKTGLRFHKHLETATDEDHYFPSLIHFACGS